MTTFPPSNDELDAIDNLEETFTSSEEDVQSNFLSPRRILRFKSDWDAQSKNDSSSDSKMSDSSDSDPYFVKFIRLSWNDSRFGGNVFPHRLETEFEISEPHFTLLIDDLSSIFEALYHRPWKQYIFWNRVLYTAAMIIALFCIVSYAFFVFLTEVKWFKISWEIVYIVSPILHLFWIIPSILLFFWRTVLPLATNYRGKLLRRAESHMQPYISKANAPDGVFKGILFMKLMILPQALNKKKSEEKGYKKHRSEEHLQKSNRQEYYIDEPVKDEEGTIASHATGSHVKSSISGQEQLEIGLQLDDINLDINHLEESISLATNNRFDAPVEVQSSIDITWHDSTDHKTKYTIFQRFGQVLLTVVNELVSDKIYVPHLLIFRPNDQELKKYKEERIRRYMENFGK